MDLSIVEVLKVVVIVLKAFKKNSKSVNKYNKPTEGCLLTKGRTEPPKY
tara:strand:+ start:806 stop:952 length:147 start_codon:yes stop_codon:yes gene_type:complete